VRLDPVQGQTEAVLQPEQQSATALRIADDAFLSFKSKPPSPIALEPDAQAAKRSAVLRPAGDESVEPDHGIVPPASRGVAHEAAETIVLNPRLPEDNARRVSSAQKAQKAEDAANSPTNGNVVNIGAIDIQIVTNAPNAGRPAVRSAALSAPSTLARGYSSSIGLRQA
jgi:hypothetical protein